MMLLLQNPKDNNSKINGFLILIPLLLYTVTGISPIWHYLGLHRVFAFLLLIISGFVVYAINKRTLKSGYILFGLIVLVLSLVSGIYWGDFRIGIYPVFLVLCLNCVSLLKKSEFDVCIDFITVAFLLLLLTAWVGSIYAFFGGQPTTSFVNPDLRLNHLYLTTLSTQSASYIVNGHLVIRAAGIYDEPGTFSFCICSLATIRTLIKKNWQVTTVLVLMGFITLSLAHLIYSLIYFASLIINSSANYRKIIKRTTVMCSSFVLLFLVLNFVPIVSRIFEQSLLSRLQVYDSQSIAISHHDSLRSRSVTNALNSIDPSVFFWGIDSSCLSDIKECHQKYGSMSFNPLSPLIYQGFFSGLAYYVVTLYFLCVGLSQKPKLIILGMLFLLLPRPYVLVPGYEIWIVSAIRVLQEM